MKSLTTLRRFSRWIDYAVPAERDYQFRPPDPPPPEQMTLPGIVDQAGPGAVADTKVGADQPTAPTLP